MRVHTDRLSDYWSSLFFVFFLSFSVFLFFFFFFSSRRRHTRFDCDWSSDVCSSDLSVARITPKVRKIIRSRCGNAAPDLMVKGIARAAASETPPRIPAQPIIAEIGRAHV